MKDSIEHMHRSNRVLILLKQFLWIAMFANLVADIYLRDRLQI